MSEKFSQVREKFTTNITENFEMNYLPSLACVEAPL